MCRVPPRILAALLHVSREGGQGTGSIVKDEAGDLPEPDAVHTLTLCCATVGQTSSHGTQKSCAVSLSKKVHIKECRSKMHKR